MYIEFRLPGGAGGMAAGYTKQAITRRLKELESAGRITIVNQVHQPYRFRIELANDYEYTVFALLWERKNEWFSYTTWNESIDSEYDKLRYVKGS